MYKGLILTSSGIRRDTEDHIVTKLSEKKEPSKRVQPILVRRIVLDYYYDMHAFRPDTVVTKTEMFPFCI